jgi:hypothetical protein
MQNRLHTMDAIGWRERRTLLCGGVLETTEASEGRKVKPEALMVAPTSRAKSSRMDNDLRARVNNACFDRSGQKAHPSGRARAWKKGSRKVGWRRIVGCG